MCECQGNPLARVILTLGLPYLLVNRANLQVVKLFKAAEHSFSAHFCWCNLARAQGFQNWPNMPSIERSFYLLTPALSVLFFSIIACSVLMALVFYYNDILEKVTMQRTQQFSGFVCYRKNPVKCNACAVARKIETDCFSRNAPIFKDPVVRISRNLVKKNRSETTWMIYNEKSEFSDIENF